MNQHQKHQSILACRCQTQVRVRSHWRKCFVCYLQQSAFTKWRKLERDFSHRTRIPRSDIKFETVVAGSIYIKDVPHNQQAGFAWYKTFGPGPKQGWLSGHPYGVTPVGLSDLEQALKNPKDSRSSVVKHVLKIEETPGIVIDSC